MFAAWIVATIFGTVIALSHRYRSWEDYKAENADKDMRTKARYEEKRAAERKAYEDNRRKRHEARRAKRTQEGREAEERLKARRERERKWFYGVDEPMGDYRRRRG
ncbi:hypothetical protein K470DRAFT_267701 [Piedraia hortae CBS 480.64]|uniref:Uncharacterized protein n=1 Tax=Piedraia hortae CBS 480.64 TaxID=1314780 RepID=A0A6A7CAK3_9PEZI|nr:hypothetical protein K470DRAFT_267701 [Piedraia hortae CBS 480.64]